MNRPKFYIVIVILFVVALLLFIQIIFLSYRVSKRTKLVIDHDGGADDAMAIFIALLRERHFRGPEVLGITTVHGNVNESQCFINTQRILDVADRRDVPIYRGSPNAIIRDYPEDGFFGTDGLGDNEVKEYREIRAQPPYAVFILLELSKKYKDELIVVTLGPLTNIALAIRIDPDFINRLKHLYVGAGTINDSSDPKPEYNALHDIEAYYIAAQKASPDKVSVFPFSQVKKSTNLSAGWRKNVLGAIKTRIMRAQNGYEDVSLPKANKWQLLDPAVMSAALNNDIIETTKYSNNSIILNGVERGIITNNFKSENPNVNLVYSISENVYEKYLIETFSEHARRNNAYA